MDSEGNSYITGTLPGGYTYDFGSVVLTNVGLQSAFVEKLDPFGEARWVKQFTGLYSGGISQGMMIAVDNKQNIYLAGTYSRTLAFDGHVVATNGLDIFLVRLDSVGNLSWAQSMGGAPTYWREQPGGIALDAAGSCYLAGTFYETNVSFGGAMVTNRGTFGRSDVFVAKYNSGGSIEWAKGLGGSGDDSCGGVAVDRAGNCYVTGSFSGSDADFDGLALTNAGYTDIFVVRLDSDGKLRWIKQAGGAARDSGLGVSLDFECNCYLVGLITGTALFDSLSLTPRSISDSFLARINGDPPSLNVSRIGNQMILYWPTNKIDFILESSANLSTNVSWSPVTNPSAVVGDQRIVVDDLAKDNRFYRMKEKE